MTFLLLLQQHTDKKWTNKRVLKFTGTDEPAVTCGQRPDLRNHGESNDHNYQSRPFLSTCLSDALGSRTRFFFSGVHENKKGNYKAKGAERGNTHHEQNEQTIVAPSCLFDASKEREKQWRKDWLKDYRRVKNLFKDKAKFKLKWGGSEPMQLPTHGQWWSKVSTQLSQNLQCFPRGVL
jgi:hypothetical protein